jgi:hypothetical protein
MTAQGPRKGEPSSCPMRNGFRTQPARSVRGSSRRIMTMRFRPANIRVINRRVCSWAAIGPAVQTKTRSRLTSGKVFPLRRPSTGARVPDIATGGSGGNTARGLRQKNKGRLASCGGEPARFKTPRPGGGGLTRSLHIRARLQPCSLAGGPGNDGNENRGPPNGTSSVFEGATSEAEPAATKTRAAHIPPIDIIGGRRLNLYSDGTPSVFKGATDSPVFIGLQPLCAGQGLRPSQVIPGSARLKPCPDTRPFILKPFAVEIQLRRS